MDPELLASLFGLGAKAFASGFVGHFGSQLARSLLGANDEQRLQDIYLAACSKACASLSEASEDKVQALANFLGSETVGAAMSQFLTTGRADREVLAAEWAYEGGDREDFDAAFNELTAELKREAVASLPLEQQLTLAVLRTDIESMSKETVELRPTQAGAMEVAEGRIADLESAVLREFDARVDDAIAIVKEQRHYKTAKEALEMRLAEAKSREDVQENHNLLNKLYVNLTVCAERLVDLDAALGFAKLALEQKPEDARSQTNLAVAMVKQDVSAIAEALELVNQALRNDDEYRPAHILKLSLVAELQSAKAALDVAHHLEWAHDDSAAQYVISSIYLQAGDREHAVEAARRAVELTPKADHLAWLGHLLSTHESDAEAGAQGEFVEFRIRGLEETAPELLLESLELLRQAADTYAAEERTESAEAVRIDIGRLLFRLERPDEAQELFEEVANHSTVDAAARAAYVNLIELKLPGNVEEALGIATDARSRFPNDPALQFVRARAIEANGNVEEAAKQWKLVAESAAASPPLRKHASVLCAGALLELGDLAGARAELNAAGLRDHPFAVMAQAQLLEKEQGSEAARDWILEAAGSYASQTGLLLVCADYLRRREFEDDAETMFQRALSQMAREPSALTGQQLMLWAEVAYFARAWDDCVLLDPNKAMAGPQRNTLRLIRAAALEQRTRFEEALDEYDLLAADNPTRRDVVEGLASCSFRLGRPDRAIPHLERLANSPDARAHDHSNLSALYAMAGDIEASVRAARRALELAPDDQRTITAYIALMLRNGRVDDAVRQLQVYTSKFPESDLVQVWRGAPEELSQRFIDEVFLPMKERHDQVGQLYAHHPLPIGMMAKSLGRSYVNLWRGILRGELNGPFRVARGLEFGQAELDAANATKSIVLDLSACLTLSMLKLLSTLPERFDSILVPQSVLDGVRDELLQNEEEVLRGIITTFDRHHLSFHIVPIDDQGEEWLDHEVRDAFGQQEYEALALARSSGSKLLSDDLGMRDLARQHEVDAFGTRTFLELAVQNGTIDAGVFSDAIVTLVRNNYHFISYNGAVLSHAMKRSTADAEALLTLFRKPDADIPSYGSVFAAALCAIWLDTTSSMERSASEWTIRLLHELLIRGGPQSAVPMLSAAVACIGTEKREALAPMMMAVCILSRLPDDVVVLLTTLVALSLAGSGQRGDADIAVGKAFVDSLGIAWRARVRGILREGSKEAYAALFDEE